MLKQLKFSFFVLFLICFFGNLFLIKRILADFRQEKNTRKKYLFLFLKIFFLIVINVVFCFVLGEYYGGAYIFSIALIIFLIFVLIILGLIRITILFIFQCWTEEKISISTFRKITRDIIKGLSNKWYLRFCYYCLLILSLQFNWSNTVKFEIIINLLSGWIFNVNFFIFNVNFVIFISIILTILVLSISIRLVFAWFNQLNKQKSNLEKDHRKRAKIITGILLFCLMFVTGISLTVLTQEIKSLNKIPFETVNGSATRRILNNLGKGLESYQATNPLPVALKSIDIQDLNIPTNYYDGPLIDEWGNPIFYSSDGKSFVLRSYGSNLVLGSGDSDSFYYGYDLIYFSALEERDYYGKVIDRR
jgi:hypothetical protein